jgi:beta-lactamase superfamily II metal-dependent hydrolase
MIKISFKNVDQGDSIVLEWTEKGENRIGIIDCSLNEKGENPVLDYIRSQKIKNVEFVILSHPHLDHFSGLPTLLEYCRDSNIQISSFIHTCSQVRNYIKSAISSTAAIKKITKVFKIVKKLRDDTGLNEGAITAPFSSYPMGDASLTFLSPTSFELDKYVKNESYHSPEESGGNTPNANWLSTVIKISIGDSYILLTSDTEKYSLVRIDKSKMLNDENLKLILAQSPHHGAKRNHSNSFWKKRNYQKTETPIVFSVGKNSYGHVSEDTLSSFEKLDYKIYSTNPQGALLKKRTVKSVSNSQLLNTFSHLVHSRSELSGDQEFLINSSGQIV